MTQPKRSIASLYEDDIRNRIISHRRLDLPMKKSHNLQLLLLSASMIAKWLLSFFVAKSEFAGHKVIGISWSPIHDRRFSDLATQQPVTIPYHYKRLNKTQIALFKGMRAKDMYAAAKGLLRAKVDLSDIKNSAFNYDGMAYRLFFALEYALFDHLVKGRDTLFIAGINDRISIITTNLCRAYGIKMHMLQHGLLDAEKYFIKVDIDVFYYMYEVSLPCLKYFVNCTDTHPALVYLPRLSTRRFTAIFDKNAGKNIAYATQPGDGDVAIIDEVIKTIGTDFNLLLYIHPVEKHKTPFYQKRYEQYPNVFVCQERHANIELIISQCSTLGIEYHEQGITPLFINLYDDIDVDIAHSDMFVVYTRLEEFSKVLKAHCLQASSI